MLKLSKLLTVVAFGALLGAANVQAEPPSCPICLDDYTRNSLVVQFDCPGNNSHVNHHACLDCANDLIPNNDRKPKCPLCRAEFSIHNPLINENTIHHLYRKVTPAEQNKLNQLFRAPVSHKQAPDSVFNYCVGCDREHEGDQLVRFTCNHDLCIPEALKLAQSDIKACPTCGNQLILVDPLKQENGRVQLIYRNGKNPERAQLEKQLGDDLQKLRSVFKLYQEHIPANKRVRVQPRQQQAQRPNAPVKPGQRAQPPVDQNRRPDDLPEVAGFFPDMLIGEEEIRLNNTYLPAHLSKKVWQVVVQPDGTYARARRARELSHWPSERKRTGSPQYKDFTLGALCGLLLAPELKQKNTTLRRVGALPALLISGKEIYDTYQKDTKKGFDQFVKWGIGIM